MSTLFSPMRLGDITLQNRIVMAPMTRNRAGQGNVPTALNAHYYRQRSSAGLIITEATQISAQGVGYPSTPGIHTKNQVEGWKGVSSAVHEKGGKIFMQLWHVGRISHSSLQPGNALPVAPSAIKPAQGKAMTYQGLQDFETPRALEQHEIPGIVNDYRLAAINAKIACFDGIEIHAANGYLLDQFLRDSTNQRTDRYGGSFENRVRLLVDVIDAILTVWPANRVGIRLSPSGTFNSMSDSNPEALFKHVVRQLNLYNLAYLHVVEMNEADARYGAKEVTTASLRDVYEGNLMVCGDYTLEKAKKALTNNEADLFAFGRPFIANPDLPARLQKGIELNGGDPSTYYGGTEKGYTDYQSLR